jgi:hypothetical protein
MEYETQLNHLIAMARLPGFKDQAWLRAQELDEEPLFNGIKDDLIKRMKEINANSSKG